MALSPNGDKIPDRTASRPGWVVRAAVSLLGAAILVGLLLWPLHLWLRAGIMLAVAIAVILFLSSA